MGKKVLQNIVYVKRNPAMQRLMLLLPAWVTPNAVTLFRAALIIPVIFLLRAEHYWAALGVLGCAFLLDFVDGALSEARGLESVFGAFMDPLADKILVCGTLIAIVDRLPASFMPVVATITLLAMLLTALRIMRLALPSGNPKSRSVAALPVGKLKFIMQVAGTLTLVISLEAAGSAAHLALLAGSGLFLLAAIPLAFMSFVSQLLR